MVTTDEQIVGFANFLQKKREKYSDLSERVAITTPWDIVTEICEGNYSHVDEAIEKSLMLDVTRITAKGL